MIGKILRGAGFRGSMDYLCKEGKEAEIVGGNMVGTTAQAIAKEFAEVRRANSKVKKPVLHIILAQPPGERLASAQWAEISQSLLSKLGLADDRPWIAVRHADCDHDHIHLVTSRIDFSGHIWLGHWQVKKLLAAKAEVEREFGLSVTPLGNAAMRVKDGHVQRIRRELEVGLDPTLPPQPELSILIDEAIAVSDGEVDVFERALVASGVSVKFNRSKTTGRVAGASFQLANGEWVKGSQIGKDYSWKRIAEKLAATRVGKAEPSNKTIEHENVRSNTGTEQSSDTDSRNEKHSRGSQEPRTHVGVGPEQQFAPPATGERRDGAQEAHELFGDARKRFPGAGLGADVSSPGFRGSVEEIGSRKYGWHFEHLRQFLEVMVRLARYATKRASKMRPRLRPWNCDDHSPHGMKQSGPLRNQSIRRRSSP